jgi:isoleucyl-tRNA synthetase
VIREFGADATRLYFLGSSDVWKPKRFDRGAIAESAGSFLMTLKSAYTFLQWYAPAGRIEPAAPSAPLDRWLESRQSATVTAVNQAWDGYNPTAGVRAIMDFVVEDISLWWIRRSRARFWAPDREAEPAAVSMLFQALVTVARLLAPAAPFVSDWLHRALTGTSVHLAEFPSAAPARDLELEAAVAAVRKLASLGRAAREARNLRVRQPLSRMRVALPASADGGHFRAMLPVLAEEVNVRAVEVVASDAELVRLRGKPNFRELGKAFGKDTPKAAAAAESLSPEQLRELESGKNVTHQVNGTAFEFAPAHVTVQREVASDWLVQSSGSFVAALDPTLDAELSSEGLARELINRVQRLRKDAGYAHTTRIELWVAGPAAVLEAAQAHAELLCGETLARALHLGERPSAADREETLDIDGHQVTIAVRRHPAGTP